MWTNSASLFANDEVLSTPTSAFEDVYRGGVRASRKSFGVILADPYVDAVAVPSRRAFVGDSRLAPGMSGLLRQL